MAISVGWKQISHMIGKKRPTDRHQIPEHVSNRGLVFDAQTNYLPFEEFRHRRPQALSLVLSECCIAFVPTAVRLD